MNYYNIDKLIKITVRKAQVARLKELRREIKIFGITIQRAGVYRTIFREYEGQKIPKGFFVKDGELYDKPEVTLRYQSDYGKTYYFDTYEQAEEFAEEITSKGNFIK